MSVRFRHWALPVAALALLAVGPGCAKKYAAERDGKDAGEQLCDVRDADAGDVQDELEKFMEELDDIASNYAVFTSEDRADIEENLSDLAEHVADGDDALIQQDLTVIRRSLENIDDDLDDTAKATIDGFLEGLDDCVSD
jgi:hypothetical protein